jgi:hypothetical protein
MSPSTSGTALFVAQKILELGVDYDKATVVFNRFRSAESVSVCLSVCLSVYF